jgi:2'-5' RNA ligase
MSAADPAVARLFFAALPDAATRVQIATAAAAPHWHREARLVPRDNYHATLAFVGTIPTAAVSVLEDIGDAQRSVGFTLRFEAYEYWPKPEVVVMAARLIPTPLEQLWQGLHVKLAEHGWALAPKRLRPHVTLAKKITQPPVLPIMSTFDWTVSEFSLMRSEPGGAHAAYTVVATWPLLDEPART